MLPSSPANLSQTSLFNIVDQLDASDPLLVLSRTFDWSALEAKLSPLYSLQGRAAKPICLMSGLLILKQLYNLSDESVVEQWRMNPYYQVFCGEVSFQTTVPCHATELVKFPANWSRGCKSDLWIVRGVTWKVGRRRSRVGGYDGSGESDYLSNG